MVPDTFRAQTILWTVLSLAVFVFGLSKMAFGQGAGPFIGMGATLFFLFTIVRPLQRRRWLQVCEGADPMPRTVAARLLTGPAGGLWRNWMHLNVDGGDRDRTN